ncbi:MAG TPA: alpha/beta hydrolase [Rhizomicrobium sp.]
MVTLRTRTIATRDGVRLRTASWDARTGVPDRGLCVILDGQTEYLEKYTEVVDELGARGFSGAILDWRGQGGSDRALTDPLKAHVRDFSEFDLDLAAFMDQVVVPMSARPAIALAHSMGAHILLRRLHDHPDTFRAAVMTAPMLRPSTRNHPAWLVRMVCRAYSFCGAGNAWVWGMQKRDPLKIAFEDNLVTSDRGRFARAQAQLAAQADLRLAGPTWGWLEAAYASMAQMTEPGYAQAIAVPCLIFGAGRDRIVETGAIRDFAKRLPRGEYVEFADAEHEILMENDSIRARFWAAFDDFVTRTA